MSRVPGTTLPLRQMRSQGEGSAAGNTRYSVPYMRDPLRPSAKSLPQRYMPTGNPPKGSGTINWPMYPQEYEAHNVLRTPSRVAEMKAAYYRVPSRAAEGLGINNDRIQAYAHWRGTPGQIYSTPAVVMRNPAGGGSAYGTTAAPTTDVVTTFERTASQIWTRAYPTYKVEPVVKDSRPMHETPIYNAKFPLGYTQGRRAT